MKENVTIWSSPNRAKFDDIDTIKEQLLRNRNDVGISIISAKLKKDQEDIRTYLVDYEYTDLDNGVKDNFKK